MSIIDEDIIIKRHKLPDNLAISSLEHLAYPKDIMLSNIFDKLFHCKKIISQPLTRWKTTAGPSALEYHYVLAVGQLCMHVHSGCPSWAHKRFSWTWTSHPWTSMDASMNGTIKVHIKQFFPFPSADVHGYQLKWPWG